MNAQSIVTARGLSAAEVPPGFLFAKLRGRRARLYEGDRLRALAESNGVGGLARRLFPGESVRDHFELELRLQARCVQELAFLARYVTGRQRRFYIALLDRFRLENLKTLLRLYLRAGEARPEEADLVELPEPFDLPRGRLMDSSTPREFIERIPIGPARRCALEALPLYEETGRKAWLEMALDRGYWRQVGRTLGDLSGRDRRECSRPVVCEFDGTRLVALLRAAKVYELPWDRFGAVLPTGWGRLSVERMRELYENPEPEAGLRAAGRLLQGPPPALDPEDVERVAPLEEALWHETIDRAEKTFRGTMNGFAVLTAYFYLTHEELRHLLSLTQMLRRGRSTREIMGYLSHV
ncbi:MAG: V0D/AC39 family V-type ATPase subunit [Planctomycetota bacterium]